MTHKYDDILHLPHPTSTKHPRMPIGDRAAIFRAKPHKKDLSRIAENVI